MARSRFSCILTSASLHDSQAAIPLATVSAERTTNLYDLMDAAYDAQPVREYSRSLGHVPLIDINTRGNTVLAGGAQSGRSTPGAHGLPTSGGRALPRTHGWRACQWSAQGTSLAPATCVSVAPPRSCASACSACLPSRPTSSCASSRNTPATSKRYYASTAPVRAAGDGLTIVNGLHGVASTAEVVARTPGRGPEHAVLRCRPNICSVLE